MIVPRTTRVLALTLTFGLAVVTGPRAWSQEAGKPKDDALESLLEKLAKPADAPAPQADRNAKPDAPATKPDRPAQGSRPGGTVAEPKGRGSGQAKPDPATAPAPAGAQEPKVRAPKPDGPATVAPKDQELDELLQKLGETKETPAPDDRPRSSPGTGQNKEDQPSSRADQPKLGGKDKEIDDRLEELTGRRKRRNPDDEKRSGPVGQIIKEMREVEQKLGKPDTSEGTRNQQKQIVKRIETLIEEMKRSGSSMGRLTVRPVRRPGRQQGGQQPGSTAGAMPRGAPLTKPSRPTTRHSDAGGKDIWGHLPPEVRQEIDNSFNEMPLASKQELIDRYLLSVDKGKLIREE
jgi:hypothetical protein